ncbi:unnamed protein product, partial [Gulo gulo]
CERRAAARPPRVPNPEQEALQRLEGRTCRSQGCPPSCSCRCCRCRCRAATTAAAVSAPLKSDSSAKAGGSTEPGASTKQVHAPISRSVDPARKKQIRGDQ